MIRKKKKCKSCRTLQYIFSKGKCKRCAALTSSPKPKKEYLPRKLEKQLDRLYSQIRRMQATGPDGWLNCFICGKKVKYSKSELMHYIGRGNKRLRFNDINTQPGCYTCNRTNNGNLELFAEKLKEKFGYKVIEWLEAEAKRSHRYNVANLEAKVRELTYIHKSLSNNFVKV